MLMGVEAVVNKTQVGKGEVITKRQTQEGETGWKGVDTNEGGER